MDGLTAPRGSPSRPCNTYPALLFACCPSTRGVSTLRLWPNKQGKKKIEMEAAPSMDVQGERIVDRVAVFVDAGYLFAEGSRAICGRRLPRIETSLDETLAREKIMAFAENISGLPVLRIYWYDSAIKEISVEHENLAQQPGVKLRLGHMNRSGGQHGVDAFIVNDMITLAGNRAMADCVLVAGDGDLQPGVEQAQQYGIRIHLVGIVPEAHAQSKTLRQEADSTSEWSAEFLGTFLKCRGVELVHHEATATGDSDPSRVFRSVAEQIADEVPNKDIEGLVEQIKATNRRPQELDGRLLALSRKQVGYELGETAKAEVRDNFLQVLMQRIADTRNEPDGNQL